MRREELIALIKKSAKGYDYIPYTGFEYRIGTEIDQMPAVWIVPPKMVKKEGQKRGLVEYQVEMHLIKLPTTQSAEHREVVWSEMEGVAMGMMEQIESSPSVKAVVGQSYLPKEWSLTNRGELSIEVSFRVQMQFCNG